MHRLAWVIDNTVVYLALSLLSISVAMSTPFFYNQWLGHFNPYQYTGIGFVVLVAGLSFFLLPVFFSIALKKNLATIGLQLPANLPQSIWYGTLAFVVSIPCVILMVTQAQLHAYYTFDKVVFSKIIWINISLFPTYYFFEEFFFRGFLFLSLWEKIGWHAYWLTEFLFILAHLGKPWVEIGMCIPIGIALSALALKTRSIYPCLIVHMLIGMSNIFLVNYNILPVMW